MVDNIYLESVLKPWSSLNQVTSIDKLDMIRKVKLFPSSFIVNTKDFPEYGHWIVIIFTSPTHSIFFDSLALPMIKQKNEISAFIKKNSETYEYNLITIQVLFLITRSSGRYAALLLAPAEGWWPLATSRWPSAT